MRIMTTNAFLKVNEELPHNLGKSVLDLIEVKDSDLLRLINEIEDKNITPETEGLVSCSDIKLSRLLNTTEFYLWRALAHPKKRGG